MTAYRIPLVGNSDTGDAVMFVTVDPRGFVGTAEARVEIATSRGIERAVLQQYEVEAIVRRLQEVVQRLEQLRLAGEYDRKTLKGVRDGVPLNQVYAHGDGCRLEDA